MRFKFTNPTSYGEMARDLAIYFEALHLSFQSDSNFKDEIGSIDSLNIYVGYKNKELNSSIFNEVIIVDEESIEEARKTIKNSKTHDSKRQNHLTVIK